MLGGRSDHEESESFQIGMDLRDVLLVSSASLQSAQ